ncbi:CHAT domain-containing protein [Arthrospira platensis]|uniref:CHAT domain-containing protein n=1 Tax=Limnospira TaxID=2596745 RepID=UPI0001C38DA7|nr:CHAT domain-containing protein [Arthrospira platensis]AMW29113.1 heterocyst differentiation protein [Arthrospira platensis YZ]KDR55104.1 heterocyst differentiation protein [Arthrospira platensis str. Paraca]MBD2671135.1 CHAT domain-containing protein [Arthrospira platensis FACHB-439]MBD2711915.1 CHAT domain-containing protein [Arthrospira platensis FACHB-835]MDT9312255.1 CHAT domain-containing protein [Limnospira sp. Paracas R14]QQW26986.1 CHAT domain-containing protein [Arthrospira sp. PC
MTQEFLISVTPLGDDEYWVRTEKTPKVPSGVPLAEEKVKWPVEEWLEYTRYLMKDPLLEVLEGSSYARRGDTSGGTVLANGSPSLSLVELGQELYDNLFFDTLRDSWTSAQAIAHNRKTTLQLRLGLKGQRLNSLPWEVLHEGGRPLATGCDVVFSRYRPESRLRLPRHSGKPNQPLRILMAIAAPNDLNGLQLKQEALHLQQELKRELSDNGGYHGAIEITILEQPDREKITQALEQGQYQIFHYAGHSGYTSMGGALYLVNSRTGLSETISGDDLAGLLVNNGVLLAVLNSCRGAYSNPLADANDTAKLNLAEALVQRGVPGVLAMAERIPDEVALMLTSLFYRQLNQGLPIDLSLSRARQGLISAYGSHQIYWALPVLYLHNEFDGILIPGSRTVSRTALGNYWEDIEASSPDLCGANYTDPGESADIEDWSDDERFDETLELEGNGEDVGFIGDTLQQLQTPGIVGVNHKNSRSGSQTLPPSYDRYVEDEKRWKKESDSPRGSQRQSSGVLGVMLVVIVLVITCGLSIFGDRITAMLPYRALMSSNQPIRNNINSSEETLATGLEDAMTDQVSGIAIEQFERANLEAGVQATEELLNREAVAKAGGALSAVLSQYQDEPAINFLRGRFIWQSIERGSADYSLDDVRRFWARAVDGEPNSLEYNTALGFAYYRSGDLQRAYQTWYRSLELAEPILSWEGGSFNQQLAASVNTKTGALTGGDVPSTETEDSQEGANLDNLDGATLKNMDVLNAYAGLGLVLMKSAESLTADEQVTQLSKAVKFRDKALSEAPEAFKSHALGSKWLWSTDMMRDWELLLRIQSGGV